MKANEVTRQLRKTIGMKAWNSKRSKFSALTICDMLQDVWRPHVSHEVFNAVSGIKYAHYTGRIDGGMSLTLRDMTGWELTRLAGMIVASGAHTTRDVVRWLLDNRESVMALVKDNRWV